MKDGTRNPQIGTAFVMGIFVMLVIALVITFGSGAHMKLPFRYTVAELTDAIATREANFAERAVELEGEK